MISTYEKWVESKSSTFKRVLEAYAKDAAESLPYKGRGHKAYRVARQKLMAFVWGGLLADGITTDPDKLGDYLDALEVQHGKD